MEGKLELIVNAEIRLARESDAEGVHAIYAPIVRDSPISFEFVVPAVEEVSERITSTLSTHPWLVYVRGDDVLGYAYGTTHRTRAAYQWSAETSVYVSERARGRGVATALYTSLFEILKLQGFFVAFAGITLPNPASVGFHESFGFTPIGVFHDIGFKQGKWWHVGWWERPIEESRDKVPSPPRMLADVESSNEWQNAMASGIRWLKS